jgi:hypothetical protein
VSAERPRRIVILGIVNGPQVEGPLDMPAFQQPGHLNQFPVLAVFVPHQESIDRGCVIAGAVLAQNSR